MDIYDEHDNKKPVFSLKTWKNIDDNCKEYSSLRMKFLIIILISAVIDIVFPLAQTFLINNYIEKNTLSGIAWFAAVYFVVLVIQVALVVVLVRISIALELYVSQKLRRLIFEKYQKTSVSYFNNRPVGYLVSKTISDTERISWVFSWGLLDLSWAVIYLAGIFIPMFILSPPLAAALLLVLPLALLFSFLFQKNLLIKNREIRKANSAVAAALNEGITGAKTTKTLNADERLSGEFLDKTQRMYKLTKKFNAVHSIYVTMLFVLGSFILALILAVGGYEVKFVGMNIGKLSAFLTYSVSLIWPIMQVAEVFTNIVANQANAERVLGILAAPSSINDKPGVIEKYGDFISPKKENWEEVLGDIEFKNVSFKYEDGADYILRNFNLKIPRGSSLAIVGETGAGKTTIINLLCRFFEPCEGEILIDGKDYRERSQLWLAHNLGYVLQTPHLFSGTITDNIRYGNPAASFEEIKEAAELISCDKIIERTEKGYDSEIGECGDKLSVGEKQLITFARAIVANPKIIVLDEATSSIDTETEKLVQTAITHILKDRTSIIIAHRLSTIKNSDNIIVLEGGEILENGNHKQLMSVKGHYFRLYSKLYEINAADSVLENRD